jgi:hypothetical protein
VKSIKILVITVRVHSRAVTSPEQSEAGQMSLLTLHVGDRSFPVPKKILITFSL